MNPTSNREQRNPLRDYQVRGIEGLRAEMLRGHRRVLLVLPTGGGKTIIISDIARRHVQRGGRVLVVVHRRELVDQTVAKLSDAGIERVGVIAAGQDRDHAAPVLVASVQTLLSREALPEGITLLVLDEAHHYVADEWKKIAAHYGAAYVVGVTATPERSDGTPLGDIFDALVVVAQTSELIAQGHLVPIDVVAPERTTSALCADPVEAWLEHASERPGVIFAASVEDAKLLAERLTARGRRAVAIWGDMPSAERAASLSAFKAGDVDVLTNVHVLTEGFDAPIAQVCMLARGCDHVGTFLQMVGRVLRPHHGKTDALLIDLRGVTHEHGRPDDERFFSLEGRAISGVAPTRDCPACGTEIPLGSRICPECGLLLTTERPAFDAAPLVRLTKDVRERLFFTRMLEVARERGFKPGWAAFAFEKKFGRKPWGLWRKYGPGKAVA